MSDAFIFGGSHITFHSLPVYSVTRRCVLEKCYLRKCDLISIM